MSTDVEVEARLIDGQVHWHIADAPAHHHKIDVKPRAAPEKIVFHIKDDTNLGFRFDCSQPFHVWEQDGCPPEGIKTDQIRVIECSRQKLVILDANTGDPRQLRYWLKVVDKHGSPCPCDPIVNNGGGGPGFD